MLSSAERKYAKTFHTLWGVITMCNEPESLHDFIPNMFYTALFHDAYRFGVHLPESKREEIEKIQRHDPSYKELGSKELVKLTGHDQEYWAPIFRRHEKNIVDIINDISLLRSLPDEIWEYLEGITLTTRDEIEIVPRDVIRLVSQGFDCPSCGNHCDPRKMIHKQGQGNTYLGKTKPNKLHFKCPKCHNDCVWLIDKGKAEKGTGSARGCLSILITCMVGVLCAVLIFALII